MKVKLILFLITVKKKLIAAYSMFITYGNTAKDEKKDLKNSCKSLHYTWSSIMPLEDIIS